MEKKEYRHFYDAATVEELLSRMKKRHGCSYEELLAKILPQLKDYYQRCFQNDTPPSRFEKTKDPLVRERFLVALSGGIDSSVVTFLAVLAVGRDAVLPVTMPARPGDESVYFAALIRNALGFTERGTPYLIDIEPLIQAHMKTMNLLGASQLQLGLEHKEQDREQKMRSGNFGSRIRIAILSDLQRAIRGRILGTSNRTEYCQGYSTKFGTPISYDYGVLDELYKIDIYELARVLKIPDEIIDTPPSTGYFAGQTHEGELGATVEEQDIFAYLLFEENLSPAQISRTYKANESFALIMKRRFEISEHKRLINKLQERVHISLKPLQM